MKKWLFIFTLLLSNVVQGQRDQGYDTLISRAGLYHLQKNPGKAIPLYEQAFSLRKPDALSAYKAAGVYALDSNSRNSFFYLQAALDSGWTEAGWLLKDEYFNWLRTTDVIQWELLKDKALDKERAYESTLTCPLLRRRINEMSLNDQRLRYERVQAKTREQRRAIDAAIRMADSTNLVAAKEIIAQYGWPGIRQIGKDGQNNLWLVVQHADVEVVFQRKVLKAMSKLLGTKELNPENYAFLFDRVQCNLNYKQLYGTQVNWTHNGQAESFRAISQEQDVDKRRAELGLLPLSVYALSYGFHYKLPDRAAVMNSMKREKSWLKNQLDSAAYYSKQRLFDKAYDLYNEASAVQGGMSSAENYQAAKFFSNIAIIDPQEKYRSIALDFLYLLFLRGECNRHKWMKEKTFLPLHTEERWKAMLAGR
jgi:hypothetical protein